MTRITGTPNAGVVFASQAGPIFITWRKAAPYTAAGLPAGYVNLNGTAEGSPSFQTNGADIYLLYTARYIVSSGAVKQPQQMYWTEGSFQNSGYLVSVPSARVSAIHVAYNNAFPATVSTPYADPNYVPPVNPTNMSQETRTLWMDTGTTLAIHAYNAEGRVFVELLGGLNPDGITRQYLGFEIVDVAKQPRPSDVTTELGERLAAFQDGSDDSYLYPQPIPNTVGTQYYYQQSNPDNLPVTLYADRKTDNLNDLQVHWLIPGVAGLQWPYRFVRYTLAWPADPAKYSHYLRPLVATEAEAEQTAVALDGAESPSMDDYDPLPAPYGAKLLTSPSAFYTFLSLDYPAHRTLLRFLTGGNVRFERVFSWLNAGLTNNALLANSVATSLSAWNPTNSTLSFTDLTVAPYVVKATVNVGQRIQAPANELGAAGSYWAGYILQTNGKSFDPTAYIDPFAAGFTLANQGAIIPVNAIPGQNLLEVWWFRQNNANLVQGFQPVYWPTVIGCYTIQWPDNPPEIVLASSAGSGPLPSPQAKGSIYYQNDRSLPGYNPNEEHALMLGGQAYALRDDLNVTNANGYSSAPYVLINYTESDGRPAMAVFKVRREKPEAGILFDYMVTAGTMLQPPMPLPLLPPPIEGTGQTATNYNNEPVAASGDLPVGWDSSYASGTFSNYQQFTFQDRKNNFWVYRGLHAGLPPLQAGSYNPTNGGFDPLPDATALVGQPFTYYIHLSRPADSLTVSNWPPLPDGLAGPEALTNALGFAIHGIPIGASSNLYTITIYDSGDGSYATNTFSLQVVSNGTIVAQGPLCITSTNQYSGAIVTYTNRPPQWAQPPTPTNSFTMHFYYETQPGFAWPGIDNPPPEGTIVPYLRRWDPSMTNYVGGAADKNSPSLDIVYRPVWPSLVSGPSGMIPLPKLFMGQTLTVPINGLPQIRGQSSVQVLYQQSIGLNITQAPPSVVLFDPTAAKESSLAAIGGLPSGVVAQSYEGRMYFPNLPPNLAERLWFDPNTTNLVFEGQFMDEPVGDKYLLLNVLRGADLAAVQGLCPAGDQHKSNWDSAVLNLTATVLTKHQPADAPGSYVVNTNQTFTCAAGDLIAITNADTQVDSYALSATGPGTGYISFIVGNSYDPAHASEPVTVYIARLAPDLWPGQLKIVMDDNPLAEMISFQHTDDLAGDAADYEYDWRIMPPVDGLPSTLDPTNWPVLAAGSDLSHYTLGGSGTQALSDNYVTLRYRCTNSLANPASTNWSAWTDPQLAEGWIKRVLQGVNPFNQRTTDLFDNPANTTASIISQAGPRWEGDVALNQDTLNNDGLIEIYETVLDRGKALSINAGINYGPANDALLLAAGYLNDLYMDLGNEAWANAANPTISIGTDDQTYGSVATAMFVFQGEVASLLEQNLALLRGRDDSLEPGVTLAPVYNRLYWNYTYGINAGEVIYALNYDITDQNGDGVVNAADAAIMYPQGHGDAYGHYLTALTGYYSLLMNPNFDWVPHIEAVTVLGATVNVGYQDERKFAAAAGALARAGQQIFDLTWRQYYQPGGVGWGYFATNTVNYQRPYVAAGATNYVTRYWGLDHWASRMGQGAYINWLAGNAILPPTDPDPTHQGIQKVDRTTVPELQELPQTAATLQTDMDNANAGFTPLGLSQNSIAFDINPLQVTGADPQTHFEQIYQRAVAALNNAVVAFDDAQGVTQTMRSQEDSLTDFEAGVAAQELAYTNQLIELYGTPYPDDIGPGQTYAQGYDGPDLIHYTYVDNPDTNTYGGILPDPTTNLTFKIDIQQLPPDWAAYLTNNFNVIIAGTDTNHYQQGAQYLSFNIGPNGFFDKPPAWTSDRSSPGSIQQAISALIAAQNKLRQEMSDAVSAKQALDQAIALFNAQTATASSDLSLQNQILARQDAINVNQEAYDIADKWATFVAGLLADAADVLKASTPVEFIAGLADGGDIGKCILLGPLLGIDIAKQLILAGDAIGFSCEQAAIEGDEESISELQTLLNSDQSNLNLQNALQNLASQLSALQGHLSNINQDERALNDAQSAYQAQVAQGNRILQERLTFRQHAAAIIQGYRTRDAAFRIFQNEKLERYKTLFDLAAKYAFLAANAYDYETGLLNTDQGKAFVNRIVSSCALGVIENGQPQYAGSDTGDPGLSSALAEMKADFDVLKGRLGFNNPDGYGTIVSLRAENYRILPGADGDVNWQDVLNQGRMANLLEDSDVTRYCMQIDDGSGLPVPGIVLTFGTVISPGLNLFGQPLAPCDSAFSSSSFATKIFAVGVDLDGYVGMRNPVSGGASNPSDPNALAATPYIYLIPVGTDSMRVPPLGDTSGVRTWNVDDVAIPLPFNISASDFSSTPFYQSADSLSEPLFAIRKDQAFRPVSTTDAFNGDVYGATGSLQPSQFTNKRLIGRSIWNSKWKLVIPGNTLLNDANQGLDRFLNSVKDIKLYFVTYSYAGN